MPYVRTVMTSSGALGSGLIGSPDVALEAAAARAAGILAALEP